MWKPIETILFSASQLGSICSSRHARYVTSGCAAKQLGARHLAVQRATVKGRGKEFQRFVCFCPAGSVATVGGLVI